MNDGQWISHFIGMLPTGPERTAIKLSAGTLGVKVHGRHGELKRALPRIR